MQHDASADMNIKKAKDKADAIKKLAKFYKSYDFELKNGVLHDLDDDESTIDVQYDKQGNVIYFMHADGDGPVGSIEKI